MPKNGGGDATGGMKMPPPGYQAALSELAQKLSAIEAQPIGVAGMPLLPALLHTAASALGGDPQGRNLAMVVSRQQQRKEADRVSAILAAAPRLGAKTQLTVTADGKVSLGVTPPDPTLAEDYAEALGVAGMVQKSLRPDSLTRNVRVHSDSGKISFDIAAPEPTLSGVKTVATGIQGVSIAQGLSAGGQAMGSPQMIYERETADRAHPYGTYLQSFLDPVTSMPMWQMVYPDGRPYGRPWPATVPLQGGSQALPPGAEDNPVLALLSAMGGQQRTVTKEMVDKAAQGQRVQFGGPAQQIAGKAPSGVDPQTPLTPVDQQLTQARTVGDLQRMIADPQTSDPLRAAYQNILARYVQ